MELAGSALQGQSHCLDHRRCGCGDGGGGVLLLLLSPSLSVVTAGFGSSFAIRVPLLPYEAHGSCTVAGPGTAVVAGSREVGITE